MITADLKDADWEIRKNTDLTAHQRRIFVAVVIDGIRLETLAVGLNLKRNAIYKPISRPA